MRKISSEMLRQQLHSCQLKRIRMENLPQNILLQKYLTDVLTYV